ncbi:UDP-glucose dehydrogenase family protein [Ornithinibacillus californiensis]|uniref:UDP-glucose dehydrogenase family protein n=1 Tax=Ornithinibacillus californiensis TaxID=161536 RepID=UPI00064D7DFA|nr:UDP-glucose/GDP-mannose dehydrogenase family protein [Ornithinibacillus californiensis]
MNIAVVGTGYVGLVTGVSLAEVGHHVRCIDLDTKKMEQLKSGRATIWEPGLEELMVKNMAKGRLFFTTEYEIGLENAEVIYIAVGTPEKEDGSADIQYVEEAAKTIAKFVRNDALVVIKSTVPVGTNDKIYSILQDNLIRDITVDMVSNPEFLREGTAIQDAFRGDRIVVGAHNLKAIEVMERVNKPFGIPIFKTDIRSAEMIKYASNAFLATKISFINEIANICERVGANVDLVAQGMGMDERIGSKFLKAGIGYGGSCFPKDTKALIQIAGNVQYDFDLLKGVVQVNQKQQMILVDRLLDRFTSLKGKRVTVLGLTFKPNTDDMREAASIIITNTLITLGADVICYDPVAMEQAMNLLHDQVKFADSMKEALLESEAALLLTEWDEFKEIDLDVYQLMKSPIIFDGRNCYPPEVMAEKQIEYYSIGRPKIPPLTYVK